MRSKRLTRLAVAAVACVALVAPAAAQVVDDWREIPTPPLPAFDIPEPRRVELPNGMVIFLQPDRELPLIQGTAVVRGGEREVPAAKSGLIDIYGEVWRTGGTKTQTGDQLDDFLEARAAKVETGGDIDSTSISFDALADDFDEVFGAFVDLLRNPEFREEKLALAKTQLNTGISRRNDDPSGIASREATRLAYGLDSPYARVPEYDTVAAVTREDLLAWHQRHVHPNNIILGVTGDFDPSAMEQKLRRAFSSWNRGTEIPESNAAITPAATGVYFIAKDDVTQAQLRFVHEGVQKNNPDLFAIEVMNEVLSGGFSGRLMNRLRTQEGLTYGVGGGVGSSWDHPGAFTISMATKNETTSQAIDTVLEELGRLREGPITPAEVQLAKDAILNSFIFRVDTREEVLAQQMNLEFYGYPLDWLDRWRREIEKLTPADVQRVAQKYVHPERMTVLVVGKEADFDAPLSERGTVQTIDITIPAPGASTPREEIATDDAGRALVSKVIDWVGGEEAVEDVRSVRSVSQMTMKTPQGEMAIEQEALTVWPDRARRVMKTPMGEITMVATPDAAFMRGPMGAQDLPASQKEAMMKEMQLEMLALLRSVGDEGFSFAAAGTETVDGVDAQILEIDARGERLRWWIDPATGRVLRRASTSSAMGAPVEQVVTITEWQTVDGIRTPKRIEITMNGEPAGSAVVTEYDVNPEIPAGAFDRE